MTFKARYSAVVLFSTVFLHSACNEESTAAKYLASKKGTISGAGAESNPADQSGNVLPGKSEDGGQTSPAKDPPAEADKPAVTPPVDSVDPDDETEEPTPPVVKPADPVTPAPAPDTGLNFANVNAKVLKVYCLKCHNNAEAKHGINVETYASTKMSITAIRSAVFLKDMPNDGTKLPEDLIKLLTDWADKGAPEK